MAGAKWTKKAVNTSQNLYYFLKPNDSCLSKYKKSNY